MTPADASLGTGFVTGPDAPETGLLMAPGTERDAAELTVLQRCCWVEEAIANNSLDIPALHESVAEVAQSLREWETWCLWRGARLVGSVRARQSEGADGAPEWFVGRLMVAPDLAGQGWGSWLLRFIEGNAPEGTVRCALFTGAESRRNLALYERHGYRVTGRQGIAATLAKPLTPASAQA